MVENYNDKPILCLRCKKNERNEMECENHWETVLDEFNKIYSDCIEKFMLENDNEYSERITEYILPGKDKIIFQIPLEDKKKAYILLGVKKDSLQVFDDKSIELARL